MTKDLPGHEEANRLGYSLGYSSGNRQSAVYTKDGICLDVGVNNEELEANLSFVYKLLVVKTPGFSFPSKNFHIFESQIFLVKRKLEGES